MEGNNLVYFARVLGSSWPPWTKVTPISGCGKWCKKLANLCCLGLRKEAKCCCHKFGLLSAQFLVWKEGNVVIKCEIKRENLQELDLHFCHRDSCILWFSAGLCIYFIFLWEGRGTGGDELMSTRTWIARVQTWEVHKLKRGSIFKFFSFSWAKNGQIV